MPQLNQSFGTDEHWVAAQRRKPHIRRIAVTGRAEWKHLPVRLARRGQKIDQAVCRIAQVANAETARQGSWMKQDAAAAREFHLPILQSLGDEWHPFHCITKCDEIKANASDE